MKNFCFTLTFLFMLFLSSLHAQDIPILLSPLDGDRHIKTTKLSLLWFGVEEAEQYQIQLATHPDFLPQEIILDVKRTTTSVVTPELSNLTTYYWRVKVDDQASPWSDTWRFTTTGFATIVTLTKPADGSNNLDTDVIEFEWTKDSVNSSYNLQISTDPEFPDTIRNVFVDKETAEVTNLQAGILHYWRVKSFNIDDIPGAWSDVSSFKTRLRKPTLIAPANFANNQDTSLIFRWSRVTTASIYDFQISTDEKFEADTLLDTSLTTDRIQIKDLLNDKIYYWRLKSRNAFSDSSLWSEPFAFKTRLSKPRLIQPLNMTRNNELDLMLIWTSGEDLDFYHVQVAEDSLFRNIFSDSFAEFNTTLLLNLENNKFYYWRVSRQNTDGDSSSWSKKFTFKTKLASPELLAPKNNSVKLSFDAPFEWSFVDSADYYNFELAQNESFNELVLTEAVEDTVLLIDTLKINSQYFWRVKAENEKSDTSEWSDIYTLNTSALTLSISSIDTTINFSSNRIDTIAVIDVTNSSDESIVIESINTTPDTLFRASVEELMLNPNQTLNISLIADTSRIDTGLVEGSLNFIRTIGDTTKLPINLFAKKAIATFSTDLLKFDSTLSSSQSTKSIRLSNRKGNITLDIAEIKIEGPQKKSFRLNTEIEKVIAGDSSIISITFKPTAKDSNFAFLVISTNSYPSKIIRLPIVGIGRGGEFTMPTLESLKQLEGDYFTSMLQNKKKLLFENNGDFPIEFSIIFSENYFKVADEINFPIKLQPNDTASLSIKYLTPNFDSLNVDTLVLVHNALLESPIKFPLSGTFDSSLVVNSIRNKFKIDGQPFNSFREGMQVPFASSIQLSLSNDLLEEEENLDLRIGYFAGGPGNKLNTLKTNDNRFIIPFNQINERGILFKGELFTRGLLNEPIDSITIFDFIDVQVETNDFQTASIKVPLSSASDNPENADVNWVLFGYPFEQVLSDSAFADLGDPSKMQDGQWVVYEYNSNNDNFELLDNKLLEAGKAYFIAQGINEAVDLSYKYENSILTRKLSDDIITLNETGWKTISSPYTFEVEVDTPAILYRYDTFAKSYKLTNIMRPGAGYFVSPEISELRLINYGEYFPSVFPKIFLDSDWFIDLQLSNGKKSEQLFISGNKDVTKLFKTNGTRGYRKAPKVDNYFEAYFSDEFDNKLSAIIHEPTDEFIHILVMESPKNETIKFNIENETQLPSGYSYLIIDELGNKIGSNQEINLLEDRARKFQFIYGTFKFISDAANKIKSTLINEFTLKQNYPNPFNPVTTIQYNIPVTAVSLQDQTGGVEGYPPVSLIIYDILGRIAATLVNEPQVPGTYTVTWNAVNFASGIYFYELKAGEFTETKKLVLLK